MSSALAIDQVNDADLLDQMAKEDPEKAAIAFDITLKRQVTNERESWIIRARMVHYLKETGLWQHYPGNFATFNEYCQQPEIDIAPSIASDMSALCTFDAQMQAAGIDIWDVIRHAGHSKVRQIIPQIREAARNGVLKEEVRPLIEALGSMSFREVIGLTETAGVRSEFNLEATYSESASGAITVTFKDIGIEDLEYLARKAGIKRWYSPTGLRIDPPLNK